MRKELYLHDTIEGDFFEVDSIEDAKEIIISDYTCPSDGIHPDIEDLKVYQLVAKVVIEETGEFKEVNGENQPICNIDLKVTDDFKIQEDIEILRKKAAKYDEIEKMIMGAYEFDEETGEPIDNGEDLCSIGEKICDYFGMY